MRLIRHKLYMVEDEIFSLSTELENNELELDELDQMMVEVLQAGRLRQLINSEKKANLNARKQIYREKVHWKITSNRAKKILNNRTRYNQIIEEVVTPSQICRFIQRCHHHFKFLNRIKSDVHLLIIQRLVSRNGSAEMTSSLWFFRPN